MRKAGRTSPSTQTFSSLTQAHNSFARYANINQVFYDLKGEAERCKGNGCKQIEYDVIPFEKGD